MKIVCFKYTKVILRRFNVPKCLDLIRMKEGCRGSSHIRTWSRRQASAREGRKRAGIKNRQKSIKKGFENYEILWWQLKCKMEPCSAKSYGERRHMRFEHGHFFSMNWKNENVSFFKMPVTFKGQRLSGTYDPRRKLACQRWTKEQRQVKPRLGAMRRL